MLTDNSELITYKDGSLYCLVADIWIDPNKAVNKAIITHAHFDHFAIGCAEYFCTFETATLLQKRVGKELNIKIFDYGEEFKINGIAISFHPSGHILGSSQIKFQIAAEKWLITGDFKRQKDDTCESYEVIKTDYLISESTFGLPIFKWDEPIKIAKDIIKWTNRSQDKTSILFCYSLGKAQRLLNEISKTDFNDKIYVHNSIKKINDCYQKLGIDIKDTQIFEKSKMAKELKGKLILLPPSLNKSSILKNFQSVQTGFASGWMSIRALRKRAGYDKGFVISDHADWEDILNTIEESETKNVFFNHGNSEALKKYLKEKNLFNIHDFEYNK